jgi:hypothetical protein
MASLTDMFGLGKEIVEQTEDSQAVPKINKVV